MPASTAYIGLSYLCVLGLNYGNIYILHKSVFIRSLRESLGDSAIAQELTQQ